MATGMGSIPFAHPPMFMPETNLRLWRRHMEWYIQTAPEESKTRILLSYLGDEPLLLVWKFFGVTEKTPVSEVWEKLEELFPSEEMLAPEAVVGSTCEYLRIKTNTEPEQLLTDVDHTPKDRIPSERLEATFAEPPREIESLTEIFDGVNDHTEEENGQSHRVRPGDLESDKAPIDVSGEWSKQLHKQTEEPAPIEESTPLPEGKLASTTEVPSAASVFGKEANDDRANLTAPSIHAASRTEETSFPGILNEEETLFTKEDGTNPVHGNVTQNPSTLWDPGTSLFVSDVGEAPCDLNYITASLVDYSDGEKCNDGEEEDSYESILRARIKEDGIPTMKLSEECPANVICRIASSKPSVIQNWEIEFKRAFRSNCLSQLHLVPWKAPQSQGGDDVVAIVVIASV